MRFSCVKLIKGVQNNGVVSHENSKTTDRKFHIIEIENGKYKLKIKRFCFWFYVRENFKVKVFKDFSSVVNYVIRMKRKFGGCS